MYICMYMYVCAYMCVCKCVCTCMYVRATICLHSIHQNVTRCRAKCIKSVFCLLHDIIITVNNSQPTFVFQNKQLAHIQILSDPVPFSKLKIGGPSGTSRDRSTSELPTCAVLRDQRGVVRRKR